MPVSNAFLRRTPSVWTPEQIKDFRRNRLDIDQVEFARILGVPVKTVRNWEQDISTPKGPVRKLLDLLVRHPELFELPQHA